MVAAEIATVGVVAGASAAVDSDVPAAFDPARTEDPHNVAPDADPAWVLARRSSGSEPAALS